jgi:hypothetical protein
MSPDIQALVAGPICLDIQPDLSGMDRKPFVVTFVPGRLVDAGMIT